MKIGLIDVDSHNFPNLPLMKLSAWHKAQGDEVEWWWGHSQYDRIYMAKVFSAAYSPDVLEPVNAKEIIRGGTGYAIDLADGKEVYHKERDWDLPPEAEHIYPDYSLYPKLTKQTAYGFLTRGCPRGCGFCHVGGKEGAASVKVADLSEWWRGQKNIVLLDPNLLACRDRLDLLAQLAESKTLIDYTQGLDARMMTGEIAVAIANTRFKDIHFAWDSMKDAKRILAGLETYAAHAKRKPHGHYASVYVLTNYGTTMAEDRYRVDTLRALGYDPCVMIYNKPSAPSEVVALQRWANNKRIFRSTERFEDYDPRRG